MICKKLDFIDIELEETVKGYLIIDENEIIYIAGSLEKNSEHPLAEAIIEKENAKNISLLFITCFCFS